MRWIMGAIALAFLLSTFLMYDMRGGRRSSPPSPSDNNSTHSTHNDYPVAVVNGRDIMRSEMDLMFSNYVQQSNNEPVSTDIPYIYQTLLDNMVFQMELGKEVSSRNLVVGENEITAQVNIMADRFPTREAFFQAVERSGVKMEDLRQDIKRQLLTQKTIENCLEIQVISEDAVLDFYNVMKGFFYKIPKGFTFDVIEVSDDRTAEDLRVKIAEDSGKWEEIVSEHPRSSDITKKSPEPVFFSELTLSADSKMSHLISLDIGEVGHVAELNSNDFMIAIKRENKEESVMPFDEVSMDIRTMLEGQQERSAIDKFRGDLLARAVVEIKDHSIFPAPQTPNVEGILNEELKPEEIVPEQKEDDPNVSSEPSAGSVTSEDVIQDDPKEVAPEAVTPEQNENTPNVSSEPSAGSVTSEDVIQDDPEEVAPEAVTPEQNENTPGVSTEKSTESGANVNENTETPVNENTETPVNENIEPPVNENTEPSVNENTELPE